MPSSLTALHPHRMADGVLRRFDKNFSTILLHYERELSYSSLKGRFTQQMVVVQLQIAIAWD